MSEPTKTYGGFRPLLANAGFQSFLWTQFLGAFNDNIYKMIVSLRAVHVAAGESSFYLSLAGAVFVLPFLMFSGYSGHLADVVSKRRVLIAVKVFEIFVMLLGIAAFFSTRIESMLVVLFLMALHSTIFSPAKYGIVPEMLPDSELSRANALLEMSTFMAIVLGTAVGGGLFALWKHTPWYLGILMTGVAVAGFLTSLKITRVPPSGGHPPFRWNPFSEIITGTRHLMADRPLFLTVAAISYFWFLGALFQMDLLLFGSDVLKVDELRVSLMVTALAIGIGAGSMLAGRLSGNKVEIGLVPLGSGLMAVFSVALWAVSGSYLLSVIALSLLGVASGIFIVPLNAYLQQRAESQEKGRMIATNNIWNTFGLLLASCVLWLLHDKLHVRPDRLILIFGVVTFGTTIYIVRVAPEFLVRFLLWMAAHTLYRIRITGRENMPLRGPALLVSNHVTFLDGFFITACMQRFIRFMIWKPYYEHSALRGFFRLAKAIPVGTGPRDIITAFRAARLQLEQGHVVCIFAEGAITRTGNLLPFKRGLERVVNGLDVPVIPVHLDGLWESFFSFSEGRFFWKWPKRALAPITVSFGKPMAASTPVDLVRQAMLELGSEAVELRKRPSDTLPSRFARNAKRHWNRFAMADSSGRTLTYGQALTGSVLVAGWIRRNLPDQEMIGVMLPSMVGGALANTGISLSGRVPVNLNFTAGRDAVAAAIAQCGIRTVLTSRLFLAKAKLEQPEGALFLEDLLAGFSKPAKLWALLKARVLPVGMLAPHCAPGSLATVIFSSGSTGVPKGVMLSHWNVISNIEAMTQVYWINEHDRIAGVLPFFHSFGFTVTLWLPLVSGCGAVYHANPTEAKVIGELIEKHKGTLLLSTPTFCGSYARTCTREQFASLRFVLVGAERLRDSVAAAFREAFGKELLEGYGCTEMAPVVA
ncbi:MAG: MFS transporter, partial [Acidobacteria bacterium]|nr:MFS transporter [Acidobacteriota bacterium]